jgi:hypothetical protein
MSKNKTGTPNQRIVMGYNERHRQYRKRLAAKKADLTKE